MSRHGPWVDLHAHPGRCFLCGLAPEDPLAQILGPDACVDALGDIATSDLAAVAFATVSDLRTLGMRPDGGLHEARLFHEGEAYDDHRRQLAALVDLAGQDVPPGGIALVADDIVGAHERGETVLLLTCEGADFVEGRLGRLAEAHDLGVRSITLVHYRHNGLGDLQTEPPRHHGLSAAGREAVAEMNRLGMIIDLAHATFETTLAVLEHSTQPVMISHTHLDRGGDGDHARLVGVEHARAVAAGGGLIGAWPAGVSSATFADFVDEICRLVDVVGIDHVAIGTDMDANYKPVMTSHHQFPDLDEALRARGMTRDEVDRVLGGNAVDLVRAVCG